MVQSATAQIFATFSIMPDRRRRIKKGVEPYFLFGVWGLVGSREYKHWEGDSARS